MARNLRTRKFITQRLVAAVNVGLNRTHSATILSVNLRTESTSHLMILGIYRRLRPTSWSNFKTIFPPTGRATTERLLEPTPKLRPSTSFATALFSQPRRPLSQEVNLLLLIYNYLLLGCVTITEYRSIPRDSHVKDRLTFYTVTHEELRTSAASF